VSGLHMPGWFGLFAPKGTPKDIIAKLNSAMAQALADPALGARLAELGLDVRGAYCLPQSGDREMVADH